ncbi:acetolactate synthase catalytic subunit [Endozoicomonas montiporae]|uniref:Acetolactate synthase n=2 Tax=Endozoicomonas montiporae TaxID=1027273 RepID=A0A081N8L7_9GAMM|nr:acetolactate synthase 2 catalytic subunit [Endozoicomonas montiporae]AMO55307.1 acetolactate synthase, large subunit [Endozoicomonas montiporae CL-33]KEQ14790.1 acetolactate synthase catalytic subunit [Endozoicomonas montiporae]
MDGAEALVKNLAQHGVTTVFGYPGGTIMPVYDALLDSPIEHLLCRHEQGAAFSAIGYARSTGRPGVCIATSGPGATNLITALSDAYMDSVPLVAITGQVPTNLIGTDAFQEMDILGMSISCTKHSFLVTDPDELCHTLNLAFEIATSGRPGPVLVDIPKDIQKAEANYQPPLELVGSHSDVNAASQNDLTNARALLKQSKRPIAYVGGGVAMAGAVEALRTFLDITHIPSACTLKGLGSVEPGRSGYLGMLGMHGTRAANMAVQECDLLLAIGARFDDRVTGKLDAFAPNAKVIHMDIDPSEFGKRRRADITLTGTLADNLEQLGSENGQTLTPDISEWINQCQKHQATSHYRYDKPGNDIFAPLLLKQLSEQLPRQAVVSCDVGQHQMWVAQHMSFWHPNNHLTSGGLGTMGFGLPAAIGAAMARPEDDIVLVSGDGSFMMNVQELATIKRRQLPVKIVLIDNQRLGMVKQWQELFFEGRYSETNLSDNPDFVTLAKSFDINGRCITERADVEPALEEMLAADTAWLLHVCIDETENVWPLVPPGAPNHEMMESKA